MRIGVLLLAVLAGLPACRQGQSGNVKIDPALAMLVPGDTVMLAGAKLEQIRATGTYRKLIEGRPSSLMDRFVRETGFDPGKDVWEVLAVSDGKSGMALARGKFSPTGGLEPKVREGAPRKPYKGYTLIGDEKSSIVFLNSSTAAAGPAAAVRRLIDTRNQSSGIPAPLLEKIRTLPAETQAWAVSIAPIGDVQVPVPGPPQIRQNVMKVFGSVDGATGWADLRKGARGAAVLTCPNPEEARKLHDALRGLIGIARLSTPDNQRDLLRLFDAFEVGMKERDVTVQADIPLELLELGVKRLSGAVR